MADNVAITAGSGTAIAADDVSSVFYQRVKLDGGDDGASSPILGSSDYGLDVDVTRIAAGTNNIGDMDIITMPLGGYCPSSDLSYGCSTDITGTAATEIIAPPGSGKYFHMTSCLVTNSDATVGTFVTFYATTDASGTALLSGYAAALGGGFAASFPAPINFGDNKPVTVKCETDSSTTRVAVSGFIK